MEMGDGSAAKLVFDGFFRQLGLPKSIMIFPMYVSVVKDTIGLMGTLFQAIKAEKSFECWVSPAGLPNLQELTLN